MVWDGCQMVPERPPEVLWEGGSGVRDNVLGLYHGPVSRVSQDEQLRMGTSLGTHPAIQGRTGECEDR